MLQAVVSRYADAQYAIDFDSFVSCLVKLEMLFSECQQTQCRSTSHIEHLYIMNHFCFLPPEMFKSLEKDGSGKIELDMQQVRKKTTEAFSLSALLV